MTSWVFNKLCPICERPVKAEREQSPDCFTLPSANYLMFPRIYRDILPQDDPLRPYFFKIVHWDCWSAWPHRERFARAWIEWTAERAAEDVYAGIAFWNDDVLIVAPSAIGRASHAYVYLARFATHISIQASDWADGFKRCDEDYRGAHPVEREAALRALDLLRSRFPTPQSVVDAVDWASKKTPCVLCDRPLGANPASAAILCLPSHRIGDAYETWTPPAESPVHARAGHLAHAACFAAWPDRPAFGRQMAEVEHRLSRLKPDQAFAYEDEHVLVLAHRGSAWSKALLRLKATGTRLFVLDWAKWLENPDTSREELRDVERDALASALPRLRDKFPTIDALLAVVDWPAREADAAQRNAALLAECDRLAAQGAALPCPRCRATAGYKTFPKKVPWFLCLACDAELSAMSFGWLP